MGPKQQQLGFCLVVVGVLLSTTSSAQYAPTRGTDNRKTHDPTKYSPYARSDPIQYFSALTNMPLEKQRQYLALIGENLKAKASLTCNIFGGEGSCQTLPSDSKFAQVCPEHSLQVDCAYYQDGMEEINDNPAEDLKAALKEQGYEDLQTSCPECFDNLRQLWCAQTVPKCGTFQRHVEGAILPAINKVLKAQDSGSVRNDALGQAIPVLLQAMSLSLPCREMCEAVVSTCSCKQGLKFGELLDAALENAATQAKANGMAATPVKQPNSQVFNALRNQPLCSLFASNTTAGFNGTCNAQPMTCTNSDGWCKGDGGRNPGPELAQQYIALQLARGLFGWMSNPQDGLLAEDEEVKADADAPAVAQLEEKYLVANEQGISAAACGDGSGSGGGHGGNHVWIAVIVICSVMVVCALGVVGYLRFFHNRDRVRSSEGYAYVSMTHVDDSPPTYAMPLASAEER